MHRAAVELQISHFIHELDPTSLEKVISHRMCALHEVCNCKGHRSAPLHVAMRCAQKDASGARCYINMDGELLREGKDVCVLPSRVRLGYRAEAA